jgi:hypothetical protein
VQSVQALERKVQSLEDRLEFSKLKEKEAKYDDFMKEVDAALKTTEFKITNLLNKVTEEMENKQKKYQKSVEASIELCTNELNENYKELTKKFLRLKDDPDLESKAKRNTGREAAFEGKSFERREEAEIEGYSYSTSDRLENCERGLKDLEQFLVAIAEEVKKIDEKRLDTSEIESRVSEKLNAKVERLSDLVRKSLNMKQGTRLTPSTPDKKEEKEILKESPKFPSVVSSHSKIYQEDPKPRSKSKESESSNSREKSNSRERPISQERSKSPKSVTSRSKKSNSSGRTPKSRKSYSSSRTPKSKSSVSPDATPPRREKNISPNQTPKATSKSKAMEASIKEKIKQMKTKDNEEKRKTLKKDEPKKTKKKPEKKSKLDKLYQELSGKP